jgi:hypothetical protein
MQLKELSSENTILAVIDRINAESYFDIVSPALIGRISANLGI